MAYYNSNYGICFTVLDMVIESLVMLEQRLKSIGVLRGVSYGKLADISDLEWMLMKAESDYRTYEPLLKHHEYVVYSLGDESIIANTESENIIRLHVNNANIKISGMGSKCAIQLNGEDIESKQIIFKCDLSRQLGATASKLFLIKSCMRDISYWVYAKVQSLIRHS